MILIIDLKSWKLKRFFSPDIFEYRKNLHRSGAAYNLNRYSIVNMMTHAVSRTKNCSSYASPQVTGVLLIYLNLMIIKFAHCWSKSEEDKIYQIISPAWNGFDNIAHDRDRNEETSNVVEHESYRARVRIFERSPHFLLNRKLFLSFLKISYLKRLLQFGGIRGFQSFFQKALLVFTLLVLVLFVTTVGDQIWSINFSGRQQFWNAYLAWSQRTTILHRTLLSIHDGETKFRSSGGIFKKEKKFPYM